MIATPLPTEKRCRRCGQTRPADAFNRHARMRDGLHSWCRDCVNERSRELRRANGQQPRVRRVSVRPGWVRCAACGKDLPVSEFRTDGRGKPHSYCKACHNAYLTELNRSKRKDPAYRAKLRPAERRRRAAQKRENASERETRLHRSRQAIDRLVANGWSLRRLAADCLPRLTLQRIRAGHLPFPETYRTLIAFEREVLR